jgi:hypothetical protein
MLYIHVPNEYADIGVYVHLSHCVLLYNLISSRLLNCKLSRRDHALLMSQCSLKQRSAVPQAFQGKQSSAGNDLLIQQQGALR